MNWQDIVQSQQYKNSDDWEKEALRNSFINQQIQDYGMNDQQAQAFRTEFDKYTARTGNPETGILGDIWRSVGSGALSATADALSFSTGGKPNYFSEPIRNYAQDLAMSRSPSTIEAVQNFGFGENQSISPRGLVYGSLSGLGSVAPMIGGGGLIGAGIKAAGRALPAYRAASAAFQGAETTAAATAAAQRLAPLTARIDKARQLGGYGTAGGLMVGGGAGHQTYKEILSQPDQVFIDSPAFQNYYRKTFQETPNNRRAAFEKAKQQLASDYAWKATGIGGAIGATSVALLGPQLEKIVMGRGATGALRGGLQGAGTEAAQEIFESGGQQLGTNYAMAPLDNRSLWYDVPNVAATNALIGAGAGGTIGSITGRINRNRPEMTDNDYAAAIKQNDAKLADLDNQLKQNTNDLQFGAIKANDPNTTPEEQQKNAEMIKDREKKRIGIVAQIRQTAYENEVNRQELTKKQAKGTGRTAPTPGTAAGTAPEAQPQWQQWTPPGGRDFDRRPGGYTDEGTFRTPRENPFNQIGQQRIFNRDGKPFPRMIDAINYAEDNLLTRYLYYIEAVDGGYILTGLSDAEAQQQNDNILRIGQSPNFDMILEGQYIPLQDAIEYSMNLQAAQPTLTQQPPTQTAEQPPQGRIGRATNRIFETAKDAIDYIRRNNIAGDVVQLDNGFWSIQPQTGSRSEESILYGNRGGGISPNRQQAAEEYQRQQNPAYPRKTPVTSTVTPTAPTQLALTDQSATFVTPQGIAGTDFQAVTQAGQQQQAAETAQARQQRELAAARRNPAYAYRGDNSDLDLYADKASQLNRATRRFTGDPGNKELFNEFKNLILEVKRLEKRAMDQAKEINRPVEIVNLVDMVRQAREALDNNRMEQFNRLAEEIRQQHKENEQQINLMTKATTGPDSRLANREYQDYLRMTADEVADDILLEQAQQRQESSLRRELQPDDTILDAVRKLGGIQTGSLEDTIAESLKAFKGKGQGHYINKNGYTVDDMGRILSQYGYLDDMAQEYGANTLSDAINDEIQGRPRFSSTQGNMSRIPGEPRARAVDGGSKITKPAVEAALNGEALNPIYRKEINRILNEADEDPVFNRPQFLTREAADIEQNRRNQAVTEDWYDRYEQVDFENADNRSALNSDDFTSPDWDTVEAEARQSEMLADAALNEEFNRTEEDEREAYPQPTAGPTIRTGPRTVTKKETEAGGTAAKKPAAGETGVTPALELTTQTEGELEQQAKELKAKQEAEQKAEAAAKQKAEADKERKDFTLTGSTSASDQAAARGQGDLLGAAPKKPEAKPEKKTEANKFKGPKQRYSLKKSPIKTGKTITLSYAKNPEPAPRNVPGMDFGQDIEPAGDYLVVGRAGEIYKPKRWEGGTITFNNPLVLQHKNTGSTGWKKDLSDMFDGKTGKALSKAIADAGYDGIITMDGNELSEAVNISATRNKGPLLEEAEARNLFVSHNITAKGVLEANKLGALAAPSIAVARSDISNFSDYGEISLLAKPELLTDRKIRAFDADIYSPRQPRAHYDINAKKFYAFRKTIDSDKLGLDFIDIDLMSNTDGPDRFIESSYVKMAYIQEQGKVPKLKNAKVEPEIKAAAKEGLPGSAIDIDTNSKFYELAQKYFQRKVDEAESKDRSKRWKELYFTDNGKLYPNNARDFFYKVKYFVDHDGKDVYQFRSDIDKKFDSPKTRKAYEKWANEKFNSLVKGKQIFKGYSYSGNRLYKAYTLENVVRDMTQKLQNGENYFYGSGSIRSAYAKEFKTIKDIQKSRNRIIGKEEFDTIKEESNNVLMDALERLKPYYKFDSESFAYFNDAGSAIAEGRKGQAEAFILNAEAKKIIDDLTEYLTALPTTYFEAKAQRAVSFSEFDTAVVPKGTDKAVLDILRDKGLKIRYYDKNVEGDRQRVIAAQNRLLFRQGTTAAGINSKTASTVADRMEQELGVKVNIAKAESDLPTHIYDLMQNEGTSGVKGVYDYRTGQAWIVSKNLENEADATKTVLHEIAGHQALSQMLGSTMDNIMQSIYRDMPGTIRSQYESSPEYQGQFSTFDEATKQAVIAEEYLADLATTNPTSSTLKRFISKVRRVLRKLFPSITWTENDVIELLQTARERLISTGPTSTTSTQGNRYSLATQSVLNSMPEDLVKDMKKVNAGIVQQLGIVDRIKGWFGDMELSSKDTWKAIADYSYTKIIDSFYPIARMEKSINQGKLLEASESATKAAARTKNLNGQMTALLGRGTPMLKDGSVIVRPDSKGMLEVFEPVASQGQLEVWEHWSAAQRSQRLIDEDKAANIQGAKDAAAAQAEIDRLRKIPSNMFPGRLTGLNAAIKEQKLKKKIANKMINQKRENLLDQGIIDRINDYVNARPELKKLFQSVHRDYQQFNREILDFAEQAGLIDPESRKLWEKDDYLPFHRINRLDEGKITDLFRRRKGLSNQKSGIMRLTGGVEQINPIESIYRNTASLIDASMKNIAMLRITDIGKQAGLFELTKTIEKITDDQAIARLTEKGIIEEGEALTPTQLKRWKILLMKFEDYGEGTAKVSRDGKTEVYQVFDPDLLRTVQALGPDSLHTLLKVFSMPARLLRAMVTTTPAFMARNFIRDTLSTWMSIHPKINGQTINTGFTKAIANVKNGLESENHWALMMAGGGSGGYYEVSPGNFRGKLTPGQFKAHHRKVIDNTKQAWDWWQKQGSRFEDANRLAVFEEVIAKGGSIAEAAHQAQEVLNFTRTGSSQVLRIMTATIPFLNARMQGLDRLARGGIDNPSTFFLRGAIYTAASMALWAAFKDDERYKALPEHEKLIWHHAWTPDGEHLRLPKPFEMGAIFATVPEIANNVLFNGESGEWAGKMIGGIFQDIFAVDYPQFMGPALEVARNKNSFTGAPIIPLGQQYQLPQSQYSPWTSETTKAIAEAMPDIAPDWLKSPKQVEHLIKGYFGTLGTYLIGSSYSPLEATTRAVRGAPSRPAGDIRDVPVIGSFIRGQEPGATRYSTEMYDMLKASNEIAATIKRYQEEGRTAEAGTLEKANKKSLENRKMLNRYSREISEIRKQTRKTLESRYISPETKKTKADQDNRKIQRIYQKAIREANR